MSKGNVTVLGSNGHIGNAAMVAFAEAGWTVTGLARSERKRVPNTRVVIGDANDVETVRSATADADVVVHALHLRYDKWGNGASEAQLQVVLDAIRGQGKTLLFPGTLYNYRASDRTIAPSLRQSGEAPRGEIRIRLEQMLKAGAAAGDFQAIILRAGDFYGPGNRGEWFDSAMLMDQAKGKLHHLGNLDTRHCWAYLPDLGRGFVRLAEERAALGAFENFHFAGHWVSHGQMMKAIEAATGKPHVVSPQAWWVIKVMGYFNPVMRDLYRMRYIWQNEMELVDPRFDALVGPGFTTPFEAAVGTTVQELLDSRRAG